MAAGLMVLLIEDINWFLVGLALIVSGNGLFKPNISTMIGQLYNPGDVRRDSGFTIFYMGINTGAMLGMLICPWLGDVKVDGVRVIEAFKWGFLAAGVAMLIGTLSFFLFKSVLIGHLGCDFGIIQLELAQFVGYDRC